MILHGAIAIARAPCCACARTLVSSAGSDETVCRMDVAKSCDVRAGNSEKEDLCLSPEFPNVGTVLALASVPAIWNEPTLFESTASIASC